MAHVFLPCDIFVVFFSQVWIRPSLIWLVAYSLGFLLDFRIAFVLASRLKSMPRFVLLPLLWHGLRLFGHLELFSLDSLRFCFEVSEDLEIMPKSYLTSVMGSKTLATLLL